MKKENILRLSRLFEESVHSEDNVEFWYARDVQKLLDYEEWRNFCSVIEKAKVACSTSGHELTDHFVDINKMVSIGSEAERQVSDMMLTRYACYLIAQNGDPRKEQIAFAQSYFALQTRKQELIEERIRVVERISVRKKLVASETELSKLIYERGVDEHGFARIRSKGDAALFGGLNTAQMKQHLRIPNYRALADFLPTITMTAKNLATEITNYNMCKEDLQGEAPITDEHVKNNSDIRKLLAKSNIQPEELPAEEDLRKLQMKTQGDEVKIAGKTLRHR